MWHAILTVLLGLRPHSTDTETPAERAARMEVVARAIDYASARATCSGPWTEVECSPIYRGSRLELASLLLALGIEESGFAERIHKNRCAPTECDAHRLRDGRVVHRSRSVWQVQHNQAIAAEWENATGTSTWQTFDAAWAATVVLSGSRLRCGSVTGAVSGYAGSPSCAWSGAPRRVALANRMGEAIVAASGD
jgi:hypothetical protein